MPINIYAFSGVRYSKLKNQKIPRISFAISELIRIFALQNYMLMTEKELNSYRLTSLEEPTDEMLSYIMKEAAAEAQAETEAAHKKLFAEIRRLAAERRKQYNS